ncbi:hypothetical protein RJ639_031144 [Escallonia herrerae]|uniref:A20-type domain-containing protein n=1 Tax=Escallonia herrerae TaxID=1293975 RepID=A0AA89BLG4_9ASTE|nr:hypothetical protein RJ639_031144 [Escallonia herrerae]
MVEEHGFEALEGHRFCANNCGFFGSSATHNYYSKCYSNIYAKEEQAKLAKFGVENSLFGTSSSSSPVEAAGRRGDGRIAAGATASRPPNLHAAIREAEEWLAVPRVGTDQGPRIVLKSRRQSRPLWLVEAVPWGATWVGSDGKDEEGKKASITVCSSAVVGKTCETGRDDQAGHGKVEVLAAAAVTVVLGVGNRVLYKLALVPLKQYPFFLAQLATFGGYLTLLMEKCDIRRLGVAEKRLAMARYVVVYFSILYLRYHSGLVTDEMLSLPKTPYLAVGLLEALGAVCGMAAGVCRAQELNQNRMQYNSYPLLETAILSGAAIPILSQSFLVWQLLLSCVFLGRRYRFNQLLGCFLVASGVVITVASGSSAGSLAEAGLFWSLLMIVSFLFQAADTILKEVIFLDARQRLKGGSVDLFVVNSFGSAFQALFICLLLPFVSKLWGIPFNQLPNYLMDGAACFLNIGTMSTGCDGAPLLPLLFIIVNMGFNISLLHLLKISSAVVSCLASTFSGFVAGAIILLIGMLIYAWAPSLRTSSAS